MKSLSTVLPPALVYSAPSSCEAICLVLGMLSGPTLPDAFLEVEAIGPSGFGRENYRMPVGPRAFVDEAILKLLEQGPDWAAFASLAIRERSAAIRPIRLNALSVSFTIPTGDARGTVPADGITAAIQHLRDSPCPPTAILIGAGRVQGAGFVVVGLWALDAPIAIRSDGDEHAALDLLRHLAFSVGADGIGPDITLAALFLPLPATAIRELPPHRQLVVDCWVSDRRYAVEDLAILLQESI